MVLEFCLTCVEFIRINVFMIVYKYIKLLGLWRQEVLTLVNITCCIIRQDYSVIQRQSVD